MLKSERKYQKTAALASASDLDIPSVSRGWIMIHRPWMHPLESLRFLKLWRKLKKELDRAPGLRSFEYRVSLAPLMMGMHIAWESHRHEIAFYRNSSHGKVAAWSMKATLTPALMLRHYAINGEKTWKLLGGFDAYDEGMKIDDGSV